MLPARTLPTHLGPYEVGAKIASGGMATLYLGRTTAPDGDETVVALKVIKDELAEQQTYVHMFLDEAKILLQLSHPNIITTREYGVTGVHRFIAMELLLGRTLMDVWEAMSAKGQRVPIHLAAWIGARVTEGLHYAHELTDPDGTPMQVIHRDVNPSNIFLTYDGRVKLIDFGLAKAVGRRVRTASGIVKGKLPYLSPEQVTEDTVDRRTDIYALGTTLWEVGTGKRLFKRETDVATVAAVRDAVVPDPRTIVADFPDELWVIVKKALEPKRDLRQGTALEMGRALDAFASTAAEPIDASTLERLLGELFTGERRTQSAWVQIASAPDKRPLPLTMPPPIPIGMAAVSMPSGASRAGRISLPPSELEDAVDSVRKLPVGMEAAPAPIKKKKARAAAASKQMAQAVLKRGEEDRQRWVLATLIMGAALVLLALLSAR